VQNLDPQRKFFPSHPSRAAANFFARTPQLGLCNHRDPDFGQANFYQPFPHARNLAESDGSLGISNSSFTRDSGCFVSGETETGSLTLRGNSNGNVRGTFWTLGEVRTSCGQSAQSDGHREGKDHHQNWTVRAIGCSGSATFTMTKTEFRATPRAIAQSSVGGPWRQPDPGVAALHPLTGLPASLYSRSQPKFKDGT
jgi:hypothetical protein